MSVYTYVVDHGEASPAIQAGTEVNGGEVIAFAFHHQFQQNEKARTILEEAYILCEDNAIARKIQKAIDLI